MKLPTLTEMLEGYRKMAEANISFIPESPTKTALASIVTLQIETSKVFAGQFDSFMANMQKGQVFTPKK